MLSWCLLVFTVYILQLEFYTYNIHNIYVSFPLDFKHLDGRLFLYRSWILLSASYSIHRAIPKNQKNTFFWGFHEMNCEIISGIMFFFFIFKKKYLNHFFRIKKKYVTTNLEHPLPILCPYPSPYPPPCSLPPPFLSQTSYSLFSEMSPVSLI